MRIGELAERAGVSPRALRHYEELGLLPARRAANGYRAYGAEDVAAVAEIRALVDLGMSLEETRPFVECLRAGHPSGGSCPDSIAVYRAKLAEVDASLARLQAIRAELEGQLEQARCQFTGGET
ncbi:MULTISPECIES: MerR family transcriptional regulator [Pseudonocardia]|uniref:DNA-binding transcriptional regulator, MerR family n=1 Tax=Pseudonocardia oroxyli TaxID=366584 RepID=A0A1G7GTC9_PSEOR|nr:MULTISPECIES: MerR family transcriptional regulator [Pseudonocardia]MCF7553211.1 MerR family transcriptional regulator [Pseudonocardia sp. WMMC193]SDE91376.1 DNA-binding transcriptional regulator, MerR family [Pseudonocardia oroxyli]